MVDQDKVTNLMKAVFLDLNTFSSTITLDKINSHVTTLECFESTSAVQVIERCLDTEIIITNKVRLDKAQLEKLPNLKLICIAATGTNNVDLIAAKSLGIAVTNVAGYAQNSVAQYIFSQLLQYYSQPKHHNNNVEQGLWQRSSTFCVHGNGSVELANKTLGLVGYGNLGKAVEKVAQAFGMKVIISERKHSTTVREGRVTFETVIRQADVLSLHCPLTTQTENLINAEALKLMKPNAVLINTARGSIVNENDLKAALKNNEIAYAILDVLSQEPPPENHPLLTNQPSNLKITAHIAWASIEAQQNLLNLIATNIDGFKQGKLTNRVESP